MLTFSKTTLWFWFPRCSCLSGAGCDGPGSRWGRVFQSCDAAGSWRGEPSAGEAEPLLLFLLILLLCGGAGGMGGLGSQSSFLCATNRPRQQREQAGESFHREGSAHSRSDTGKQNIYCDVGHNLKTIISNNFSFVSQFITFSFKTAQISLSKCCLDVGRWQMSIVTNL